MCVTRNYNNASNTWNQWTKVLTAELIPIAAWWLKFNFRFRWWNRRLGCARHGGLGTPWEALNPRDKIKIDQIHFFNVKVHYTYELWRSFKIALTIIKSFKIYEKSNTIGYIRLPWQEVLQPARQPRCYRSILQGWLLWFPLHEDPRNQKQVGVTKHDMAASENWV